MNSLISNDINCLLIGTSPGEIEYDETHEDIFLMQKLKLHDAP